MVDLIEKKRDGHELTTEEINFIIEGYTKGDIPDYQVSALAMAIFFKNMNERERADLTMAIVNSGDTIDLSEIEGVKVDKHSTGGVGDTTTPNNIMLQLSLKAEEPTNFRIWAFNIYQKFRNGFKLWLESIVEKEGHDFTAKAIADKTHISQYTAKSYLVYDSVPQQPLFEKISAAYNTSLEEFMAFAKIDVHSHLLFDIVTTVVTWKNKNIIKTNNTGGILL